VISVSSRFVYIGPTSTLLADGRTKWADRWPNKPSNVCAIVGLRPAVASALGLMWLMKFSDSQRGIKELLTTAGDEQKSLVQLGAALLPLRVTPPTPTPV